MAMHSRSSYPHIESYKSLGGYILAHELNQLKNKKDSIPLFFITGWGASPETVKDFVEEIYKTGRHVIVIDYENLDSCFPITDVNYKTVPCLEYNKAVGIHTIMKKRNINQADIISHSEGSVSVTVAVHMSPDKFRNVLLINPAGLIRHDTLLKLSYRFILAIYTQIHFSKGKIHRHSISLWINVLKYVLFNPIQSFREVLRLPYCNIFIYLEQISKKVKGGIYIMYGSKDSVFPLESIVQRLKNNKQIHMLKMKGNHIQPYLEPKKFANKISFLFSE